MPQTPTESSGQSAFDEGDDYQRRLTNPRFDLLEAHFNCKVPGDLRSLYSNHAEISQTDIFISVVTATGESQELYVQSYDPIDENILDAFPGYERFVEFALCGGPFLYMIDPTENDPEVHLFNMEGSGYDLTPLGVRLSQFVSAPRRYGSKPSA